MAGIEKRGSERKRERIDMNTHDDLARLIDHTLLRADASAPEIDLLCAQARQHGFAAVCVNGAHVERAADRLRGASVAVCAVVGFPLGASISEVKAFDAKCSLARGATEIDMVLDLCALRSQEGDKTMEEISRVVDVVHGAGAILKVILETTLLGTDDKIRACEIAERAGADFVKTSTGFGGGGATIEDVRLLRRTVGDRLGVKASGGIRTRRQALGMIEAGATRIGASASLVLLGVS